MLAKVDPTNALTVVVFTGGRRYLSCLLLSHHGRGRATTSSNLKTWSFGSGRIARLTPSGELLIVIITRELCDV
jgi:hypothetical protein